MPLDEAAGSGWACRIAVPAASYNQHQRREPAPMPTQRQSRDRRRPTVLNKSDEAFGPGHLPRCQPGHRGRAVVDRLLELGDPKGRALWPAHQAC